MELPLYFPKDLNRRLAGLQDPHRKKLSIVFQDFGRFGHVDVEFPHLDLESQSEFSSSHAQPTYIAQRQHERDQDRSHLCAQIPTLPLSDTPAKVHYPFQDCIVKDLPEQLTKVRKFSRSLKQVTASVTERSMWNKKFLAAKQTLDKHSGAYKISPIHRQAIEESMPNSITQLINQYTELSQQPWPRLFNPQYSGGLLSCVADSSESMMSHLLFHASGRKLQRLTLTRATLSDSPIFTSQVLAESKVKAIFQVHAQPVHNNIFIGTRHEDSCTVFCLRDIDSCGIVDTGTTGDGSRVEFVEIGSHCFDNKGLPTSLCMSPYLPGEGICCSDAGTICIWSADSGSLRAMERSLRFQCDDLWRHAYYALHPRQIVITDRTCVQMLDHRDGFRNSVDLFALPNKLVHGKERVMSAHHHSSTSPLHSVATNHCLFLVDQRFASTPVLQLYPDLAGPLLYLASTDYDTEGGGKSGVLIAASQHPAEAICYPFTEGNKHAVTMPLSPWRLSKVSDICDTNHYSCFFTNGDLSSFQERLGLSLAGVAVASGARTESIVCYQADCYGEIYFQQYSKPDRPQVARKTGIPAAGNRDRNVPPEVQDHVRSWANHLQEQIDSMEKLQKRMQQLRQETLGMDMCAVNFDSLSLTSLAISCCSFCGDYEDILSSDENSKENKLMCSSCCLHRHSMGFTSSPANGELAGSTMQPFCGFEADLRGIAPPVESLVGDLHDPESNTMVLMKLMKGESQSELTDLVGMREDERIRLLKDLKDKRQLVKENTKWKKQAALYEHGLDEVDVNQPQPTHTVFNSEEHLQQNALIAQVMSMAQSRPARPVTIGDDADEGGSLESPSDSEHLYDNYDQSDPVRQEQDPADGLSVSLNQTQDDDDDFFSAGEVTPPRAGSLSPTAVGRKEGKPLTLSEHNDSSDLFSSDEDAGPSLGASRSAGGNACSDSSYVMTPASYFHFQESGRMSLSLVSRSVMQLNSLSQSQYSQDVDGEAFNLEDVEPFNPLITSSQQETEERTTSQTRLLNAVQSSSRSVLAMAKVNRSVFSTPPQPLESKSVEKNTSPLTRTCFTSPRSREVGKKPTSKDIRKSVRRSLIGGF